MRTIALTIALTAVLAAVTHILIIFAVPRIGAQHVLEMNGSEDGFVDVGDPSLFATRDPTMLHRVCGIDLREGPVRVSASVPSGYWSVSVHDGMGLSFTVLNDRAAQDGRLDVVLATRRQERALEASERETATIVRLPPVEGYVLLRAIVDRPSRRRAIAAALSEATCAVTPVELPPAEPQTLDELISGVATGATRQAL